VTKNDGGTDKYDMSSWKSEEEAGGLGNAPCISCHSHPCLSRLKRLSENVPVAN